mmetsp:Transcript_48474/g.113560  ORF Transcript_48474/g.113560 Transcript_48474/m.113560 type:complete len:250 (+) Transcript_48474:1064-1813(+)
MGEGQHPAFVEGISQIPCQPLPPKRIQLRSFLWVSSEIRQSIVGKTHVPLEMESQITDLRLVPLSAVLCGTICHPLEVRGLLCGKDDPRMPRANLSTEAPQQGNAILIQLALSSHNLVAVLLPTKVAVNHGCDSIDSQPVDVEVLDPVVSGAQQIRLNLWLGIVVAAGAPPGNLPHGTFVLVLRHAAVAYQAPLVLRKVCRNKVHEHSDSVAVQRVHEEAEVVGSAKPPVHSEKARCTLVAPRLLAGIL